MATNRSGRIEEKKQKRRLAVAVVGSMGLLIFFAVFGLKILVGFSLLMDKLRGTTPASQTQQSLLLPPTLDPLPAATKSATLTVTGIGQENTLVILYVNEDEAKKVNVEAGGTFEARLTNLVDGTNTISARASDEKGNTSDLSNIVSVIIKDEPPILELSSPADNTTVEGDSNKVTVSGKTEENTQITINGRVVVVRSDATFSYDYPLNNGDNKLTIIATDNAGNATTIERMVKYQRE